jgi:hypothetical protein
MDAQKTRQVIALYREYFEQRGVAKRSQPHDKIINDPLCQFEHCHWMLDTMDEFVNQGELEKAFRWLGFVQGVLWSQGVCRLDQLREHNKTGHG